MKTRLLQVLACGLLLGLGCCGSSGGENPTVDPGGDPVVTSKDVAMYLTSADKSHLWDASWLEFGKKATMSPYTVTLDASTTYQTVDGFGAAITGSTSYNLMRMSAADRTKILKQCFDAKEGIGISMVRVSIGASDFSLGEYTWCDTRGIENFAVNTYDRRDLFPILQEIMAINPDLKIIGSPWSCPKWMKMQVAGTGTYDSWTSGRLDPQYYDAYATYFVKWIQTMQDNGFPIYAITVQNEPLNHGNSMSLYMPWQDQLAFVKVLGPKMRAAGLTTKILCFDHNYNYDGQSDQKDYPLHLYADATASTYVAGSAWHNYGGNVSTLDGIHSAYPDKDIYFTEASIGTWNYAFDSCLVNDFESIFLGTLTRYCKGVTLWNLILDEKGAPNRSGGCTTCYGAVQISSATYAYSSLQYNSHYYNIAHCSKVVRPGAVRIATNGFTLSTLPYVAFRNTDGSYAFVVLNTATAEQSLTVSDGTHNFKATVPAKSIASFQWK